MSTDAIESGLSHWDRSEVLARLRSLRTSLSLARGSLMHYRDDRVDRDRLEPAARRVDDLMDMYASDVHNRDKASRWITEILEGVGQVTNPKSAEALDSARVEIPRLLAVISKPGEVRAD